MTTQGLHVSFSQAKYLSLLRKALLIPKKILVFSKKLPFLPDIKFSFLDLFDHPGTVFYAVFMSFWGEFSLTGFDNVFFGGNFLVLSYLDISK